MSASITVTRLAVSLGATQLFSDLSFVLAGGDVMGLVGPNGAGKSTLLRALVGEVPHEAGQILVRPASATLGYLPQAIPDPAESLHDYVARRTGVTAAQLAFDQATEALATDDTPASHDRYANALETWLTLGGADLDYRLEQLVGRLGLPTYIDRPLGQLSGGQAARVAMGSILLCQADVLLLDEPTNNLDSAGIAGTADFIKSSDRPIMVASHDRAFLDSVCTQILELDPRQGTTATYTGGWTDFQAEKALARRQAVTAYEANQADRAAVAEAASRQSQWAAKGRSKAKALGDHQQLEKKFREDRARRMDQRAARARASLERMDVVEQPRKEWELRYQIAEAGPAPRQSLDLAGLVCGYDQFRVGPISTHVSGGDRIVLSGANGSGKSTLIQTLLGHLEPISGAIRWGVGVKLGVCSQTRVELGGPTHLLDWTMDALGSTDAAETRTLLAKFELGPDHVSLPCSKLSLGERTRAQLAVFQGSAVNFLVLDEPTNHLDVQAIEQLESALCQFTGTLLLVTHDQRLAAAVRPTAHWVFKATGATASIEILAS